MPLPLPPTNSFSNPAWSTAQGLAPSSGPQPIRLVPTIRSHPLPRRAYTTEPLPVRPSSHAPRQAKIVARVADVDNVAYTLEIGEGEVAKVGLDEILDYVSARDLERYENQCFVEERTLLAVAEREEKARKQAAKCRARAEKQAQPRGIFDFTSDEEEDDDTDVNTADAVTGTISDGQNRAVAVPATGRHGRARPTYTHLFLKTKPRQSRKQDPRAWDEDEAERDASSIGGRLPQPHGTADSDSDIQLQKSRRRRRKRDKVTGELLPLSPTPPPKPSSPKFLASTLDSDGVDVIVDDASAPAEHGKRQRRRRHPITKQLMPLGWRYDPEAEEEAGIDVGAQFSHVRDHSAASDMSRLSLVRDMPEHKRARLTPALEEENVDLGSESVAQSQISSVKQASLVRQIPVAVMQMPLSQYDTTQANLHGSRAGSAQSTTLDLQSGSTAQSLDIMDEDADEDDGFVNLPHWRNAKSSPSTVRSTALGNPIPQPKYQMLSDPIEIDSTSSESDDIPVLAKFQESTVDRLRTDQVKTSILKPVAVTSEISSDEGAKPKLDQGSPVLKWTDPLSTEKSIVEQEDVEEEAYFIEAILAHQLSDPRTHPRGSGNKPVMLYLVKWEGYDEPTWEPLASFEDPEIVLEYRRKAGLDGGSNVAGASKASIPPPANMTAAANDSDGGHISI